MPPARGDGLPAPGRAHGGCWARPPPEGASKMQMQEHKQDANARAQARCKSASKMQMQEHMAHGLDKASVLWYNGA